MSGIKIEGLFLEDNGERVAIENEEDCHYLRKVADDLLSWFARTSRPRVTPHKNASVKHEAPPAAPASSLDTDNQKASNDGALDSVKPSREDKTDPLMWLIDEMLETGEYRRTSGSPGPGKEAIGFIEEILREHDGEASSSRVCFDMLKRGWKTNSTSAIDAVRNVESIARQRSNGRISINNRRMTLLDSASHALTTAYSPDGDPAQEPGTQAVAQTRVQFDDEGNSSPTPDHIREVEERPQVT